MKTAKRPSLRSVDERNRLVTTNLGLAWGCAHEKHAVWPHMDVEDLAQAGLMGLMRGAELWDETRGIKFSTYAVYWVKQFIDREAERQPLIHVPQNHFRAGAEELAYHEYVAPCLNVESLSRQYTDSERFIDDVGIEDKEWEDTDALRMAIEELPDLCRAVIKRRFFCGETLDVVGRIVGRTRERVRQIEMQGLARLRVALGLPRRQPRCHKCGKLMPELYFPKVCRLCQKQKQLRREKASHA